MSETKNEKITTISKQKTGILFWKKTILNIDGTKYIKVKKLGAGTEGEVFLYQQVDNKSNKIAVKRVPKPIKVSDKNLDTKTHDEVKKAIIKDINEANEEAIVKLQNEAQNLKIFNRNLGGGTYQKTKIPKTMDPKTEASETYDQIFNKRYLFAQPYLGNKNLAEFLQQPLTKFERLYYTLQALQQVKYLYINKYNHCDIKPQNFVIDEEIKQISLIDFGSLSPVTENNSKDQSIKSLEGRGSFYFRAPESKTNISSELYSLGMTLLAILTSNTPCHSSKPKDFISNNLANLDGIYPQSIKDFLIEMFNEDPNKRPSPTKVFDNLGNKHDDTEMKLSLEAKPKANNKKELSFEGLLVMEINNYLRNIPTKEVNKLYRQFSDLVEELTKSLEKIKDENPKYVEKINLALGDQAIKDKTNPSQQVNSRAENLFALRNAIIANENDTDKAIKLFNLSMDLVKITKKLDTKIIDRSLFAKICDFIKGIFSQFSSSMAHQENYSLKKIASSAYKEARNLHCSFFSKCNQQLPEDKQKNSSQTNFTPG